MLCPICGKELIIPSVAYLNLETYNVGGSVMVASSCCNTGFVIRMKISYETAIYTGDKTEDDWGNVLRKK